MTKPTKQKTCSFVGTFFLRGISMKDYYGKCGSCTYCELGSGEPSAFFTTTFRCSHRNFSVKLDEEFCSKFEPAPGRTNEIIEKYDR